MPYRHRADRIAYASRYNPGHYERNRQYYIDKSKRSKQRIREARMAEAKQRKCKDCKGPMSLENLGGRRFLECQKPSCGRRVLLDKTSTAWLASPETLAELNAGRKRPAPAARTLDDDDDVRPDTRPEKFLPAKPREEPAMPTEPTEQKTRKPRTAEHSQKIAEGVRKAAKLKRERAGLPPVVPLTPAPPIKVKRNGHATPGGLDQMIATLEEQEIVLQAQLQQNQDRQVALRRAQQIILEATA